MIYRYLCHTVLTFRSVYLHSQINCKVKLYPHQDLKLFHVTSVTWGNNKLIKPRKPGKNFKENKPIKVWENMTTEELAEALKMNTEDLINYFPNYKLKPHTRIKSLFVFAPLAHKFGLKLEIVKKPEETKSKFTFKQPPPKPENLVKRPPVVTIMGHVDHGKTTLLDSLRNTFVTQQEFGGITQHIGAFSVEVKPGAKITFIDTPGHAAFTAMRTRGAEATDIVVLVIAADDGVMQQTVESIQIATAAGVKIIIAVNKIDKPTALPMDDIKQKLLNEGIQVEDKGGDVQLVPISALKKINLDLLTEVILLEAEVMNLRGDPTGLVEGVIVESKKEKMGTVATVIVKRGTLRKEKIIVAGLAFAKVRRMLDEHGKDYKEAPPSTPVQVFGWREVPIAGDEVLEVSSEKEAAAIIRERENEMNMEKQKIDEEIIKKKLMEHQKEHHEFRKIMNAFTIRKERRKFFFEHKLELQKETRLAASVIEPRLNLVIKGDVFGSLEVLEDILGSYDKQDECILSVVDASIGDVKLNDIQIAEVSNAIIYAFNVNLHDTVKDIVKDKNIEIRYHNVIYKLVDDLKEELSKRIPAVDEEKIIGEAEVIENFTVTSGSKKVPVAGAKCTQGQLIKDNLYKVVRKEQVIYKGLLTEMRQHKQIVKTISKGVECGLLLDSFPEKFLPGDKIICYEIIKIQRKTSWNPGF